MKKTRIRERNGRWCEVEITLENGRLSICGAEGEIIGKAEGRKRALEYWESFFEDEKGQLGEMQQRFPEPCLHTPKQGAQFVIKTDGEFHGLDIHQENGTRLYLTDSCGQIPDTLKEWFPEVEPFLKWHLNDMNAGCEHQEALGWHSCPGYHKNRETCPEPRLLPLAVLAECRHTGFVGSRERCKQKPWKLPHKLDQDGRTVYPICPNCGGGTAIRGPLPWGRVRNVLRAELRPDTDHHCDFDAVGAPCPECGYQYGTAWRKRELPPEVIKWAETF